MIKTTFKLVFYIAAIAAVLFVCSFTVYASDPKVRVDGKELYFDVAPVIDNGRLLVPMRAIFEALGAELYWDGETQTASAFKGDTAIAVQIGNPYANKNNSAVELDVPPKIVAGRTMVPLRFISEAFGCEVKWEADTRTAVISSSAQKTGRDSNDAGPIVGFWSKDGPMGSLVDPFSGQIKGDVFNGSWYTFNADGTFNYAIAGSGTVIKALVVIRGEYRVEENKIIFSDCKETYYPNFAGPEYKDKPTSKDTEEYVYDSGADTLRIGHWLYYRSPN